MKLVSVLLFGLLQSGASQDDRLVDIGFIVDNSFSFDDDLQTFREEASDIIDGVTALFPNTHFGLATFQDYPFNGWGEPTDEAHVLVRDIGPPDAEFQNAIDSVVASGGADSPESQLVSLYQSITGEGQTVSAFGYEIPGGQNFNFRADSARVIFLWTDDTFHSPATTSGYPGPTLEETVDALLSLNSRRRGRQLQEITAFVPRVVGIVSGSLAGAIADLNELSVATGAVAGEDGIDCDSDGVIDIMPDQPIICNAGAGLTAAVVNIIEETVPEIPNPCSQECGLFGLVLFGINIFCPFTGCGIIGKFLGLCSCP